MHALESSRIQQCANSSLTYNYTLPTPATCVQRRCNRLF